MNQELAIRETEVGIITPPEVVLENARSAAKALVNVISTKKKPVIINGETYLEFEDWQTVAQFYGYTVKTGEAEMVELDGVKGAKAHADLIDFRTGEIVGGAEAYCMRDEDKWGTRPKYEWQGEGNNRKRVKVGDEIVPWFQLASMAQTRAGSKALRNRLAWVVVLAGYRPTPAEEMTEGTASEKVQERRTVDKSAHYCPIHNVNFFKKGRMKGYAHPIEGTDQWCNEDDVIGAQVEDAIAEEVIAEMELQPEPTPEATTSKSDGVEEPTQPEPQADEMHYNINMREIREKLELLESKGLKAWARANTISYLNTITGGSYKKISDGIKALDEQESEAFLVRVNEAVEMA